MHKEFLENILAQNKMTCSFAFNKISNANVNFRLNKQAASVGFIYRHIGETINLFCTFFGIATEIQNSTMGAMDSGQGKNPEESRWMIDRGYNSLQQIVANTPDEDWFALIDTPFFGKVTRVRLFSHILFHNSHHCGQLSMLLSRGSNFD